MESQYYPEDDMLYIALTDSVSAESKEVARSVVLDFDTDNRLLGVEIEDVSQRLIGGDFDHFLAEEGILEEVERAALKRVVAHLMAELHLRKTGADSSPPTES